MAILKVPITAEDPAQGPESADVTLVEYGDYECPHCGRAYPIVQQVQKQIGKRLQWIASRSLDGATLGAICWC